jgi:hypothetical protein
VGERHILKRRGSRGFAESTSYHYTINVSHVKRIILSPMFAVSFDPNRDPGPWQEARTRSVNGLIDRAAKNNVVTAWRKNGEAPLKLW